MKKIVIFYLLRQLRNSYKESRELKSHIKFLEKEKYKLMNLYLEHIQE